MKRLAALLIAVPLFLAASFAAAAPTRVATVEGVTEYRLDNGLRVLLVPDAGSSNVLVHVTYFVGSRNEGYGEKGMAHLLEHLLFKATKGIPDVKEALNRHGARFNGTTSNDRTNYFETLPAGTDNLDWALSLEAERMVNSLVRKSDLDSEMTVVRNEFERGENNPGAVLGERMQRLAFAAHNYGNPVIGFRADIEQVPIERLQAFYRLWYQPDNAMLIVAGRFDEADALARVERHFGPLPRPARALPRLYTQEATQDGERSVTLRRAGDVQMVGALYRVPAGSDPDYAAIDVLTQVFATAPTGRLHRALVQKGLATSTWGYERQLHDPGWATFGAQLSKGESLDAARDALLATLEGPDREPIRADEVERARLSLLNDMEKAPLDALGYARWLGEFAALGDWRLFYVYRERLRKVTVADVQRVMERYFKPANRVLGRFVPTDRPDRAEIPAPADPAPAIAALKSGDGMQAGESFDPTPQNIEARVVRRTLANGIRVALLPKKTRGGSVIAQLTLYWGTEQSKQGRARACGFADAMLMRGSKQHSRAEIRDLFDKLQASAAVGLNGVSLEARRPQLEAALRLAAEVLREPAFPAAEFEELRRAALTGAESQRGDPQALAGEKLARHLNPWPRGHWNYPETVEERIDGMKRATLEEAKRCYEDLVGASGATFVAVGDFDPDALAKLVEELFGGWKSPAPYARIPSRNFDVPAIEETVSTPDKANAVLRAGMNFPMRDDDPDFPAMILGNYLLGGTSSARLPARIREKEGLSYATYTLFSASPEDRAASFGISSIFAPQNRDRVERAAREELARALDGGFGDGEFEAAKKSLLEARRVARGQDGALAGRLSLYLYLGRTFAWDVDFEKRVAALTPAEVRDALRRHLDLKKLSVVRAGDFR